LAVGARPTVLLYSRLFEFDSRRLGEVLARVKGDLPDVAILVVGAGLHADDAAEWQREMEAAGVLPSVIDVGWTAESALPDVLSAADVGLYLMDDTLLNRTKCPVKLADMLALGIPVVAERVGQVPEYVLHGETGFVHEVADTKSIAADLIRLLQDETLRQTLSNAAQEHIRANFSWDRLGRRLARIYGA
jgi:glycosyltransferase involved in cell wall biosynthesis